MALPAKSKQALENKRLYQERRRRAAGIKPKTRGKIKPRQLVKDEKLRRGECLDCGLICDNFNFVCFDFDHRDPKNKLFALSSANNGIDATIRELAKCDLVCANCHRLRTYYAGHQYLQFDPTEQPPTLFDHE